VGDTRDKRDKSGKWQVAKIFERSFILRRRPLSDKTSFIDRVLWGYFSMSVIKIHNYAGYIVKFATSTFDLGPWTLDMLSLLPLRLLMID